MAHALSQDTTHLPPEAIQAILDEVAIGTSWCTESKRPAIIENEQLWDQEVWVTAG